MRHRKGPGDQQHFACPTTQTQTGLPDYLNCVAAGRVVHRLSSPAVTNIQNIPVAHLSRLHLTHEGARDALVATLSRSVSGDDGLGVVECLDLQ